MVRRLFVALVTLTLCHVALAAPPSKDLGKAIADDAAAAFKEQRFTEAAELFEKAFALSNDKFVRLRNAGRAWEEAGKLEYARTQFQKYLEKVPSGPDHDEVVERLARLEARLAAEKPHKAEPVPVIAATPAVVEAQLPVAVNTRAEEHADPRTRGHRILGWALIGGGAALAAGGGAWLALTQVAGARMNADNAAGRYTAQKLDADKSKLATNNLGASVVVGMGAACVVAGVIELWRFPAPTSAHLQPLWLDGGAMLTWNGSF